MTNIRKKSNNMIRVAIVYPELFEIARYKKLRKEKPPLGVLTIAAVIEKHNFSVSVFQINTENYILDLHDFDVVGFSIPSSVAYEIIKSSIKDSIYKEKSLIILGGFHPTLYPKETLIDLKADVISIGESEETILEILNAYPSKDFSHINGVLFKKNGEFIQTKKRRLIKNIDSLPFPARHLISKEDFLFYEKKTNGKKIKMTHIMFSRGCPFDCYFCASQQKEVQFRSGKSIRSELIYLIGEYKINGFSTVDDNSIIKSCVITDICYNIRDLGISWKTLSRVDRVERNTLELMYKSGCYEIQFGVESGSPTILDKMNKRITIEQIERAITIAFDVGIDVKLFIIHGFPGENMKSTDETLKLLHKYENKISKINLFRFVPLPGSFVYENYKAFAIRDVHYELDNIDWSKYHIYYNDHHWWGSNDDFNELNKAYIKLKEYIGKTFK